MPPISRRNSLLWLSEFLLVVLRHTLSPRGLRDKIVPLLAGLLECDDSKMWTFEQFFDSVTELLRCRLLHVFYINEGRELHAYLPAQAT